MGSLTIAGWNDTDCKMELKEIIDTVGDLSISKMSKIDKTQLDSALNTSICVYLDNSLSAETKKEAFLVSEILEYVKSEGCLYARIILREALDQVVGDDSASEEERAAATEIMSFFTKLFDKHGFIDIQPFIEFSTKSGNVTIFNELKVNCFSSREALQGLVLMNEIIQSPYDYIDCASSSIFHGFESIEEYLTMLSINNFEDSINSQMESGKVSIDYIILHENLIETLK